MLHIRPAYLHMGILSLEHHFLLRWQFPVSSLQRPVLMHDPSAPAAAFPQHCVDTKTVFQTNVPALLRQPSALATNASPHHTTYPKHHSHRSSPASSCEWLLCTPEDFPFSYGKPKKAVSKGSSVHQNQHYLYMPMPHRDFSAMQNIILR